MILVDNLEDCIDSHGGQEIGVLRHYLRAERGNSVLDELITVVQINRLGHTVNNF
jgi:hypothetical protein